MVDTETEPAVAADRIKPGVKRSGTPGQYSMIMPQPAEWAMVFTVISVLSTATRAVVLRSPVPGVPRYAPLQALCYRPLRGLA